MPGEAETATAWLFKAAPNEWRIDDFLTTVKAGREAKEFFWLVSRFRDLVQTDQRVYLWRASGRTAAVVALARVTGPVEDRIDDKPAYRTAEGETHLGGVQPRAPLVLEHILHRPLTKVQIMHNSDLKASLGALSVVRWYPQQTVFPVQPDEERVLDEACLSR